MHVCGLVLLVGSKNETTHKLKNGATHKPRNRGTPSDTRHLDLKTATRERTRTLRRNLDRTGALVVIV